MSLQTAQKVNLATLQGDILHSFVPGRPRRIDVVVRDLEYWGYRGETIRIEMEHLINLGLLDTTFHDSFGRQRVRLAGPQLKALEVHECPDCGQEHTVKA